MAAVFEFEVEEGFVVLGDWEGVLVGVVLLG